jgi:hypothetical protein
VAAALFGLLLKSVIGLVDRSQQLVEGRGFLDWPRAIESRAKQVHLAPGQQADGHDPLVHDTLREPGLGEERS